MANNKNRAATFVARFTIKRSADCGKKIPQIDNFPTKLIRNCTIFTTNENCAKVVIKPRLSTLFNNIAHYQRL